mgnify:CR=1 FL=1
MNEIPKNAQGPSIPQQTPKIDQVKNETVEALPQGQVDTQSKEIKEILENPADRSAVKVDNLENDLKIFAANPELAQKALEVAELAEKRYADAGIEQPELKALAVGKAFVEEFQK